VAAVSAAPRALVVVLCALLLAACKVDTKVAVTVHDDGSGLVSVIVHFDADAASRVPDLERGLRVDDLTAAGWQVSPPAVDGTGVTYTATKSFASADQLPGVLAEITGPDGYLRDISLVRSHSFAETTWRFAGTADLSKGTAVFSDAQLAALLGGQAFGRDQATLEKELGAPLTSLVSGELSVTLPDPLTANTPTVSGRTATWVFQVGDPAPHTLAASSHTTSLLPKVWAVVAGAAAFVLLVVIVVGAVRRRRPLLRAVDDA
jgi:hypothetical protein